MPNDMHRAGIVAGRLEPTEYARNFSDLHPKMESHEAHVAADRCYFCHDAPCMTACPTSIDVPQFIREISTGVPTAAAKTIFAQNILGGMCARVCPTETLCEQACVREAAEGKPVEIGRLQRFATDTLLSSGAHPFTRAPDTGKRVAIVGAGPAGLSAAHRLAIYGHAVTIYDARPKAGGLNEYGIAAYKSPDNFAQAEIDWLMKIGGIDIRYDAPIGKDMTVEGLKQQFDAVFLAIGLRGVNALRSTGEDLDNVRDAVDFISELRQAADVSSLPVGRNLIVIGGGMTAIDAAVQSKLLGAEHVTLVYRRSKERMGASEFEQELATAKGVQIIYGAAPVKVIGKTGVEAVEFAYTFEQDGKLVNGAETFSLPADQVFKAIGQKLDGAPESLSIKGGKIEVDANGRTSDPKIWAGGDCATGGDDLTVTAVAEGRDAAEDINTKLGA